jgi:hypothetical protein
LNDLEWQNAYDPSSYRGKCALSNMLARVAITFGFCT